MQTAASSSYHILDLRKPAYNGLWGPPRLEVYLGNLATAIRTDLPVEEPQDDDSGTEIVEIPPIKTGRGSKRVAARRTTSTRRLAKRPRVAKETGEAEHEMQIFLALEHVFEMTPNKGNTYTDDQARGYGWLKDEREFTKAIVEHLEIGEQVERRVWLRKYRDGHGVHVIDGPSSNANQMFIAPQLVQDSFDPRDYDLPIWSSDVLAAAIELEQNGRAQLETHLRVLPSAALANPSIQAELEFPFTFHLHVKLFLKSPSIFRPIRDLSDTTNEAQRRLLLYIFQDHLELPADFDVDLPHFYGGLKSAPFNTPQLQKQIQPDGLESTLLPFQRNSVLWMLQHEGKTISPDDGKVMPLSEEQKPSPIFWLPIPPLGGSSKGKEKEREGWWFNVVTGELLPTRPPDDGVMGGLLAEEPGLGKTVESIALVLYNTPHPSTLPSPTWDEDAELEVSPIKGTLIVTPATLCKQWADELKVHAPHLRVLQYEGWTSATVKKVLSRSTSQAKVKSGRNTKKKSKQTSDTADQDEIDLDTADWRAFAGHFDVVLTTYNVLMKELNVARVPIKRPRREIAVYQAEDERFRSPLVMVEWQRVLMDEVQQVGGGKAAEMVSLIPRRASWAVSGTPAKAHVQDLVAPLRFMKIHPLLFDAPRATSNRLWNRLLKPTFWSSFKRIFDRYAVRTPKREAEGLDIPKQTRFVVPISLGMIERHFYDQTLEAALLELGLDARGVARYDDWELNGALLRSAIRRLRMACIHPQVGALGAQAIGGQRVLGGGVIRPIGDVLTGMVDANWQAWMTDKKNLITTRVHRSLLEQKGPGSAKQKKALEAFIPIRRDTLSLIEELKVTLASHDEKGKQLIKEANARAGGDDSAIGASSTGEGQHQAASGDPKGKGKAISTEFDDTSSPNPELLPASAEGDEHRHVRQGLLARIREAQVVLHRIEFCLGDLYHQLGKAKEEEESYGEAEVLRRSLLKTTEDSANRAIARLNQEVIRAGVSSKQLALSHSMKPGIKSENLFFEANLIIDVLDEQRKLIFEWRGRICELLTQKIVSEGDSADGNEYQRALDVQGEVEAYLAAYAALLADRREVLNQERTALAAHDDRERRLRHTKAAARAAAAFDDGVDLANVVDADNGENQELAKLLKQQRQDCKEDLPAHRALRSVMIDLGKVIGSDAEQQIAKEEAKRLRRILQEQTGLIDRMLNEMTPLRAAFNGRIAYFRQLQELSDSVAEIVLADQTLQEALEENEDQIRRLEDSVRTKGARQRFLQYIAKKSEDIGEEDKECGICSCDFETGYLLVCGHLYCDECLQLWRKKHHGVAVPCPNCRADSQAGEIHRITFGKSTAEQVKQLRKEEAGVKSGAGLKAIKYNIISAETLEALTKVESFGNPGQYGSKIQTLVRHLLLLEETDPGTKSIVFSAWADSLHIIEHAMAANGISCIRIDANAGKRTAAYQFQTNPAIRVLLLHGERENSGLNLTCAKRIMLVEPTVNISFEIQAIARVDRLGQKEETEVYCYYAIDTVEQNILDIAARKGTSLYTTSNATTAVDLAAAAVIEQQKVEASTKDKKLLKGDFIARAEQMLEVLFPDLFVDIADIVMEDVVHELASYGTPVTGPSGS
ncbi:hypothetical protein M407DRAFT_29255 [Tulasnella calospora MUT 4182]|uniref:RING-type domain-containing protein n=1 Tax=Tulasnella calospora MUT 4182 TaxID=1051891 RepID=A0A0C3Q982_9AGAM|nr:hypothetical protein M407DRAFT_29255 [Tulasnella calospora MUT 4182]